MGRLLPVPLSENRTLEIGKKFEPLKRSSSPPSTEQKVRLMDSMTGSSWAERWAEVEKNKGRKANAVFTNGTPKFIFKDGYWYRSAWRSRFTHSIQWAVRQPAGPQLAQRKLQGALEGDGHGILNGHACFSVQHLFLLSSAQYLSSSASESQHSQCYNTEILSQLCHSCD